MEIVQPKLRFPKFEGDWESKTLGDIGDVKMCRRIFNEETTSSGEIPFFKIGSFGKVADAFITKELYLNYKNKFSFPKTGDILISAAGTIGRTVIYNGEDAYFQDSNIVWIDNYNSITLNAFLFYVYQVVSFNTEGGTIQRLYNNILKSTKFYNPSLEEQTSIANFLSSVDEKLNLLKEKKALLEEYKKGVMQKIFNQELRFKDDNGEDFEEWPKIILSKVFDYKKGSGLSKDKLEDNGVNSCILYGQLYTKYSEVIFEVKSKTNSNEGLLSEKGDLLIPSSTTTSGIDLANVTALNFDNVLLGGDITVLRSNQDVNSVFYAYYLSNHKKEEIASYAQGITIVHLYYSHIKDMRIDFPCLEEQTKVANFLSAIDEKIELVATQIEDTQEYKKGLLQQMFV